MSSDAREALTFLLGFAGMAATLLAYLGWQRQPHALLVGACLSLMAGSLGAGLDKRRRTRQEQAR
jgi:hypothetical protein